MDCVRTHEQESLLVHANPCLWPAAGICGILGSTYTGEYEDIEKLDSLVEKLNKEKVTIQGFSQLRPSLTLVHAV